MRIQQALAFIGAATLSLSACADPSIASSASSQTAAASTVTVQAGTLSAQRLQPGEARHMKGAFRLEDGRILVLTDARNRLFAELDGKREELLPQGQNRFIARDSGTRMRFDSVPYANDVVVSTAP